MDINNGTGWQQASTRLSNVKQSQSIVINNTNNITKPVIKDPEIERHDKALKALSSVINKSVKDEVLATANNTSSTSKNVAANSNTNSVNDKVVTSSDNSINISVSQNIAASTSVNTVDAIKLKSNPIQECYCCKMFALNKAMEEKENLKVKIA